MLEAKTEPESRKIPSKFDVIFAVRFGSRFFTLGVDFGGFFLKVLGVQDGAKRGPNSRKVEMQKSS